MTFFFHLVIIPGSLKDTSSFSSSTRSMLIEENMKIKTPLHQYLLIPPGWPRWALPSAPEPRRKQQRRVGSAALTLVGGGGAGGRRPGSWGGRPACSGAPGPAHPARPVGRAVPVHRRRRRAVPKARPAAGLASAV